MNPKPIPVTFLAGFLGSGKTTLINRILTESSDQRFAVLVNEFGELGIDGSLVQGVEDDIVELTNGCLCCSILGDMRGALLKLVRRTNRRFFKSKPIDRILIESSGMASPGPAVQTLLIDSELRQSLEIDGVVTMVHASHISRQVVIHPEANTQIAYADRVLINHCDQASEEEIIAVQDVVQSRNSMASIIRCTHADVSPELILRTRTRDPDVWRLESLDTVHEAHSKGVSSVSLTSDDPIDLHTLKMWIPFIAKRNTYEIIRMKGVLRCPQSEDAVVIQAIYQWLELGAHKKPPPLRSILVIIGRDLDQDELQRGWDRARIKTAE